MLKYIFVLFAFLPCTTLFSQVNIQGKWKTFDDETGEAKSVVELFEKNHRLYGRIVKLLKIRHGGSSDPICDKCAKEDDRYNQKVIGMEIIRNMKKTGTSYSGGEILDPKIGKIYRCKLWEEEEKLKVRGYVGPFFRTQTWERIP